MRRARARCSIGLVSRADYSDCFGLAAGAEPSVRAGRLRRSMFYWSLFVEYMKNYAKTKLTYRADFWLEVLSDLLFQGINLIFILIVFQHTPIARRLVGGGSRVRLWILHGSLWYLRRRSSTSGISANGIL